MTTGLNLSPIGLTFLKMLDAYTEVLQDKPRKALLLPCGEAVFLENNNIYGVTVDKAGVPEMVSAGCISPVAWDDERGCWEYDDSPEVTVSAVNAPVFIDLPEE